MPAEDAPDSKVIYFKDVQGQTWAAFMTTQGGYIPEQATRSWVLTGQSDSTGKSDPRKSLDELVDIWARLDRIGGPGVDVVQRNTGRDKDCKMVVFWLMSKTNDIPDPAK